MDREIGASSSQNPSAAEASTGPNSRATASAVATAASTAAHGSRARAERQEVVSQPATTRCALRMTLTVIAPIIRAAITATYASLSA